MLHTPHLDSQYEQELTAISTAVSRMCDQAERMVRDAVLALLSRDEQLGRQILAADESLDQAETEVDQLCVRLMARRAPVGRDLRLVTATLKLVADIERIGDLAGNIVKRGIQLDPTFGVPEEVSELAKCVVEELGLAFRALRQKDATLARRLRAEDKGTDARNRTAFDTLIRLGQTQPHSLEPMLALTNVCRHLERIGDHAVNIAEMVVYMVEGKVIRHRADD
jgi:phosphate transport system protein